MNRGRSPASLNRRFRLAGALGTAGDRLGVAAKGVATGIAIGLAATSAEEAAFLGIRLITANDRPAVPCALRDAAVLRRRIVAPGEPG